MSRRNWGSGVDPNQITTAELLARNPKAEDKGKERRVLDQKEIEELLRVAKNTQYDMVLRFALATGARQAEVLGATWRAIDLESGTFHVTETLQVVAGEFRMVPPPEDLSLSPRDRTLRHDCATAA